MAACGDNSSQPDVDASVDGAQGADLREASLLDFRREALASLPGAFGGGNDGGCVPVAATCDGPEDCPMGQTCCGTLDLSVGGYTKIACQPSPCAPADGGAGLDAGGTILVLELCRFNTMCQMGLTCGTSMYLPPFLYRCNAPSSPPDAGAVGIAGHVACGTSQCAEGEECCILGQTGQAAQTYCASVGQGCSCTVPASEGGLPTGSEAGAGDAGVDASDAGIDAPNVEAAADAPAEAAAPSSDASGEAEADAQGADAHD